MSEKVEMAGSQKIKICIAVLIGLPGSGKTTLSKTLNEYFETLNNSKCEMVNYVFPVCYDELIPVDMVKWQEDSLHWKNARKNVLRYVAQLIRCLKGLDDGCMIGDDLSVKDKIVAIRNCSNESRVYIIIDDNMYYRSMRYEYYQLARLYNVCFCQIYVQSNINVALTRNSSRDPSAVVPDEIILKMAEKLQSPNVSNSWENLSLSISEQCNPERIEDIYQFLNKAAECPVHHRCEDDLEMRAESRAICSANVLHQVDVVLRKLVGEKINESKKSGLVSEQLGTRAKLLANVRRHIMDGIKAERIEIPEEIQKSIKYNHSESKSKLADFLNNFFLLHQV